MELMKMKDLRMHPYETYSNLLLKDVVIKTVLCGHETIVRHVHYVVIQEGLRGHNLIPVP
jgi:hypothetical protein